MDYKFQEKGKFAFLTFNNVYVDLPSAAFQLPDGTWAMPGVPVPDLNIWKKWIGSIRIDQLQQANLVLFVEEPSDNPGVLDDVHKRLSDHVAQLFSLMHLQTGMECASADLLCGSSEESVPRIRQMNQVRAFFQSKGYSRAPVTKEWLKGAVALRSGLVAMESSGAEFRRIIRGLNILSNGLQETGQDRLHQFVRSLEALILPDIGNTEKQFATAAKHLPAPQTTRAPYS